MATQKPKKARTDTAASTGLALPSAQPAAAAAATPTTTPYRMSNSIPSPWQAMTNQLLANRSSGSSNRSKLTSCINSNHEPDSSSSHRLFEVNFTSFLMLRPELSEAYQLELSRSTPGVPATPLATQAYYNYYPQYYSQGYGQGMPYYTAQTAYGTGYGPQAYGALGTPTTATHPYTPTAATPSVAVAANTAAAATPTAQRLIPPTAPATSKPSPAAPAAAALDTASVAQLTDALGSAGVDIRVREGPRCCPKVER